jgi:micrococcal nuclease
VQFLITLLAVVAVPAGLLTFMRRSRTWSFGPADGPLLLLLLLSTLAAPIAGAQDDNPVLVGVVTRVTDGDTIRVELSSGPITVRFDSIDTPESNQPWGKEATEALRRRVLGQEVALDVASQDRYERLIAVVYLGEENLNEWLVKQGHAWVYRQYARDRSYCAWEHAARSLKRGLWSLPPEDWIYPPDWRRWRRNPAATVQDFTQETVAGCMAEIGRR